MPQAGTPPPHTPGTKPGSDRVRIGIAPDCARFVLRIDPSGLDRAGAAFGCGLTAAIGAVGLGNGRSALCLGPDEWYLMAPLGDRDAIAAAFSEFYADCPHSLVDVGHRETGIDVGGEAATLALRSAYALDLDSMAAGTATRTLFDRAPIILIRHEPERFRIEVWRSFASHVWGLLQAAGREIALEI